MTRADEINVLLASETCVPRAGESIQSQAGKTKLRNDLRRELADLQPTVQISALENPVEYAVARLREAELEKQLRAASDAYYNSGDTLLEDEEYDRLTAELKALNPDNAFLKQVGATENTLEKRKHKVPMGSLEKVDTREEFDAWVRGLPAGTVLDATIKADGGSNGFEFEEGQLKFALTRGDGIEGDDVTASARKFQHLPKKAADAWSGIVRGETVLHTEDWLEIDPDQTSNPRNKGNGIARRKDGENAEYLRVYALKAYDRDGRPVGATHSENHAFLKRMGFTPILGTTGTPDEVWNWYLKMIEKRADIPFWADGVVVSVDNFKIQEELGVTNQRPKGMRAIKFPSPGAETVLLEVILTVGHTGAIIPTGRFTSVKIDGTNVDSALLNNWDEIRRLDIAVGDRVMMVKRGGIIPKVIRVVEKGKDRKEIPVPTCCPACGGPVGYKDGGTILYCLSATCPAQLVKKIERYLVSLNILGIGDGILEAITKAGIVKDQVDLYLLRPEHLQDLTMGTGGVRIGEKRAIKIVDAIAKKTELTIAEFIGSLGIPGLGKQRVTLIQRAVPGEMDRLGSWMNGTLVGTAERAGVPGMAAGFQKEIDARRPLIERFINGRLVSIKADTKPEREPRENALSSFCITGPMSKPRDELIKQIQAAGHIFKDSVSKGLTYLVMADPDSGSTKAQKAAKYGTKCINEAELLRLLSE